MSKMQVAVVPQANAAWELREADIPEPGPGQVLVRVHACGICGADIYMTEGSMSFGPFPLTPGHEGVGEVVAVGAGVRTRKVGDRVGMAAVQSSCGRCDWCRRNRPLDFVTAVRCPEAVLTGFNVAGAHADYAAVAAKSTALLPEDLSYEHAAPIMCVGYTAWAGIRRADPKPGERIAVCGVGGMGHLAVQYSKAAGFETIAITGSPDKKDLAVELGADRVVSGGAELAAAGGADVLLATNNSTAAVADAMQGLSPYGRLVVMGFGFDEFPLTGLSMVLNSHQVIGSAHNGMQYLAEALQMAADGKVTPRVEVYGTDRIAEAYQRTAEGKARFRTVISYA